MAEKKKPKTNAEIQKAYRERQKLKAKKLEVWIEGKEYWELIYLMQFHKLNQTELIKMLLNKETLSVQRKQARKVKHKKDDDGNLYIEIPISELQNK